MAFIGEENARAVHHRIAGGERVRRGADVVAVEVCGERGELVVGQRAVKKFADMFWATKR